MDTLFRVLMGGSAAAMVAAFGAVVLGMADRWFGLGLRGLDAYAGYAIAASLFLALPGTFVRGEHIRVSLVLERVPARLRAALEAWCLAAGIALCAALAFYSARLVWVSWQTHDVSPASDATPLWIPQIAMAVGCTGLVLALVQAAWRRWQGVAFAAPVAAAHVE